MSASSQYYRVTALVGVPHRNSVEVTIPMVGPVGPAGATGPQGPAGPAGSGGGGAVDEIDYTRAAFSIAGSNALINGTFDVVEFHESGRPIYSLAGFNYYSNNRRIATWSTANSRWELGAYQNSASFTLLYYNAGTSTYPPTSGWVANTGVTGAVPTLAYDLPSTVEDYLTLLTTEDKRLDKRIDDIGGLVPQGGAAPATGISPSAISGTAVVDSDPRLTDARTPSSTLAHKTSHAIGGSDALSPADIGAAAASHTHPSTAISDSTTAGRALLTAADAAAQRTSLGLAAIATSGSASDLTTGTVATARLGTGTANSSTFLRGDGQWQTPAGGVTGAASSASDVLGVSGANITGVDANADRIVFWDDSASALKYLEAGSGLSISGNTMTVTATGGATNLWIPASAWIPKTTAGCGVDSRETTTNDQNFDELLFDAGSDEFADALMVMPSNYNNGTVTARFYWTAASGSGTVCFALRGRAFANDDALDTAAGTAQSATDTLLAANDMHVSPATSAITIGGTPAANTPIQFTIYRDVSEDDLAVEARLLGVEIIFN